MNLLPALWAHLLANSLRSSVLIAGVFLLRALLRGRVPAQCFHLLWLLVAVRLLTPVAPASPWSLFNLRPVAPLRAAAPASISPAQWRVRLAEGVDPRADRSLPVPAVAQAARLDWRAWPPLVWLAGFAAHGLALAASTLVWQRRLREATEIREGPVPLLATRCAKEIGWRGRLQLRETQALASPAVFGFWRPCLLLPRGMAEQLEPEALRYVLLHELTHLRRRDLPALWLLAWVRAVHWFNPLVWLAVRSARLEVELACDEAVLARLEPGFRIPYGEALLQMARSVCQPRPALAAGMVENGRILRARLHRIAGFTVPSRARWIAGAALASLAAISLGADEKPAAPTSTARSVPSTVSISSTPETAPPPAAPPNSATPTTFPAWAKNWTVRTISIPSTGDLRDAFVEFNTPTGRIVTLSTGEASQEGPRLEKVEWNGAPVHARVTLRHGDQTAGIDVDSALVSRHDNLEARADQILIESKFIEAPADLIRQRLAEIAPGLGTLVTPPAPAHSATIGVLSPAQYEQVIRVLNRTKGADLLSSPSVTTRSGQAAQVEIVRGFPYPSEYLPKVKGQPLTPKAFDIRNVGVTLSVTATFEEGGTIAAELSPQECEFLGYLDPETHKMVGHSPDFTLPFNTRLLQVPSEKTAGPLMPIFSSRKVTTAVSIFDGHTIVFSNLRETEKTAPYKSPESAGRQLMAFVTVHRVVPNDPPK